MQRTVEWADVGATRSGSGRARQESHRAAKQGSCKRARGGSCKRAREPQSSQAGQLQESKRATEQPSRAAAREQESHIAAKQGTPGEPQSRSPGGWKLSAPAGQPVNASSGSRPPLLLLPVVVKRGQRVDDVVLGHKPVDGWPAGICVLGLQQADAPVVRVRLHEARAHIRMRIQVFAAQTVCRQRTAVCWGSSRQTPAWCGYKHNKCVPPAHTSTCKRASAA